MKSKYECFDRSRLVVKPLNERIHDLEISRWLELEDAAPEYDHPQLSEVARRMVAAQTGGAARILMMGAHVLRAGVNRHIIDLLERGALSHIAMNGAGAIHDYELARIGATTESVARYIRSGEFGLWKETGELNDWIREAADLGLGLGENVGRRILESDYPYKDLSVFAAAHRLSIPITVHVGIGYDILHEHPNCDGAALGAASYRDFLIFARAVQNLEGGVMLSFGSAIMAPEVYLKALAMARNVAAQSGRQIRNFATAVFDLVPIQGDIHRELAKTDPGYYFRPHKTILVRTVADGGESFYFCGDHRATLPALWGKLKGLPTKMNVAEILRQLPKLSALVVGDICLDRWCVYDPSEAEPSRETEIPRIGVISTTVTPGAGGTVANNLTAMGVGRVSVLGVIGDDGYGHELRYSLALRNISAEELVSVRGVQTFTYTKLINSATGEEDLPRVDFISTTPLDPQAEQKILERLPAALDSFDVILVSDQAETSRGGVITAAVREQLASLATEHAGKIIMVDSRARIDQFRHVIVKPNQHEAETVCSRLFGGPDYQRLLHHTRAPFLYVTHGDRGVALITEAREQWAPARKIGKPVDICGAGDSFTAGAAMALAVTRSPLEAARFGNLVASITIMKKGTGTASPQELLANEHAGD